jgi:hypothetical protein
MHSAANAVRLGIKGIVETNLKILAIDSIRSGGFCFEMYLHINVVFPSMLIVVLKMILLCFSRGISQFLQKDSNFSDSSD